MVFCFFFGGGAFVVNRVLEGELPIRGGGGSGRGLPIL